MRLAARGRIDRSSPMPFVFDGATYTGFRGDTLASALLAHGVHRVASSVDLGRPRGIVTAGSAEPSAIVHVEAPFPETMLPATMVELHGGLMARGLGGRGLLPSPPVGARYDAAYVHCDVLVIGAGPAGLAAGLTAVRSGARVIVVDEAAEAGGSLLGTGELGEWVSATAYEIGVLRRTTVIGCYDHNYVVAVERRTNHLGVVRGIARERVWRIRAKQVVLATGAHERMLAFPDNDRPGVMLAGAARTYLHRFGVLAGSRAVVLTSDDSAFVAAADLAAAGVEITAVVDVRSGQQVTAVLGEERVEAVSVDGREFAADLLLVCGGWSPALQLLGHGGAGRAVTVAGAAKGTATLAACLAEGAEAGRVAAEATGYRAPAVPLPEAPESIDSPAISYRLAEGGAQTPASRYGVAGESMVFVDLHRDVTAADVRGAIEVGLRSVEHVKRYTTAGTGLDQGRTTSGLVREAVAGALGVGEVGSTSARPPYVPVGFATLAGRNRGPLHDPVRITTMHDQHVAAGARFENVGQWHRPWFFPQRGDDGGEDMEAAVMRECRAARTDVAMMDASTLGKIELQGPDAGAFLDRIYSNMISSLDVGAIRYGVMCRPDGMVFDDGTVIRLAPDRFLVTTTTGNAGHVLDWFEEWLQTEWPHLRVYCTSVTEQWATVALVGPRSREVLGRLAPDLALDPADFPFMTWRNATVAGLDAMVCRISFSGELAYEINVTAWDGPALWAALDGITPYGTETMHVLRAEKGYPIVGQDTDGTVTPHDLGMSWVVSRKKAEFLGKRSFTRADTARADRKHLVALLPDDPSVLLPEGGAVVEDGRALGHVTSSYRSAALGRTFALALVASGRERIGERLRVTLDAETAPVTVASPVLYDPEGARRDG